MKPNVKNKNVFHKIAVGGGVGGGIGARNNSTGLVDFYIY